MAALCHKLNSTSHHLILRKGDFGFMECAYCLGYVVVVVVCSVWVVDALVVWI
jgi:hypothetical protein